MTAAEFLTSHRQSHGRPHDDGTETVTVVNLNSDCGFEDSEKATACNVIRSIGEGPSNLFGSTPFREVRSAPEGYLGSSFLMRNAVHWGFCWQPFTMRSGGHWKVAMTSKVSALGQTRNRELG